MIVEPYQKILNLSTVNEVLDLFFESLIDTNRDYKFYVDWDKVTGLVEEFKVECHILNSIIHSKAFEVDLRKILGKYPEVLPVIPILIAVHQSQFKVILDFQAFDTTIVNYDFSPRQLNKTEINLIVEFFQETGLKDLFQYPTFTSVSDYLLGVEVGMDTHARKNRSGRAMESMLLPLLTLIKTESLLPFEILTQKQFKHLRKLGFEINKDIDSRKADFILIDKQRGKIVNIETSFYAGTGSKPQEIVDSYINRQQELKQNHIDFIWVSDGAGWKGQKSQTVKGFDKIDYLLNINFVRQGLLDEVLRGIFL